MEHTKKLPIFIISIAEMLFLAIFTTLLSGHIGSNGLFIVIGFAFMIVAIPLHIFGNRVKPLYIVSMLFNILGSAWFCAMYYTFAEQPLSLTEAFTALIPSAILLLVTFVLTLSIPKLSWLMLVLNFALSIYAIVQWVRVPADGFYSFGFFASVITFMCLCAMIALAQSTEDHAFRYASFAGFGIFCVIAFIVLLILSEGDLLEGIFDGFVPENKKKVKQK